MEFDESGKTFYAYDKNNEIKSISFKHKAEDAYFEDGKNMEEKMEELFQYGNDFKNDVADAIVARGGIASADMSKDEITNAILQLDNVKFSLITIDKKTLTGNGGWTAMTGKLTSGNYVDLPLFDLVEDASKLVSVVYIINNYFALPAYIYASDTSAYYPSGHVDVVNVNSNNELVFYAGNVLSMPHSIDTSTKVTLLNDGSNTITINSIKAYVITR